jgi:RNA polymerase sigma-70 factor (ECF subfamily)
MTETSASLLEILRDHPDEEHWRRLVNLYSPLINQWLRRYTAPVDAADDLVQKVLMVVVQKLPQFERGPRVGAFRCWLRQITVNCLRDFWRQERLRPKATGHSDFQHVLEQLQDPHTDLSRQWDEEHDRVITRRILESLRPCFQETTWQAFQGVALDERSPDEVAQQLGISVNAVFIAKSRVLNRLRQEAKDLLD